MSKKPHYLYEHIRPDFGTVFYVGIGQDHTGRAGSFKRNRHYNNIAKKMSALGMQIGVSIVARFATREEACAAEIELIAKHRAAGASLVNRTLGGDGFLLDEVGLRRRNLAIKRVQIKPEVIAAHRRAAVEINARPDVKRKKSAASLQMWSSAAHRENMAAKTSASWNQVATRKKRTAGINLAFSDANRLARRNAAIRATWAGDEPRQKISVLHKKRWSDIKADPNAYAARCEVQQAAAVKGVATRLARPGVEEARREKLRLAAIAQHQRMKEDPVAYAEYQARRAESCRRSREKKKAGG